MRTGGNCRTVDREISRFPRKERLHMPGSSTTPGRSDLAIARPKRVAFRIRNGVGTRELAFAAQWLAYALPYRRFAAVLADADARLGADVDRYSFIVVDLHHLLLAGLPAHFESDMPSHAVGLCGRWRRKKSRLPVTRRRFEFPWFNSVATIVFALKIVCWIWPWP
jgi:hypothetical protein